MYKVFHNSGKILLTEHEDFINYQFDNFHEVGLSDFPKILLLNDINNNFVLFSNNLSETIARFERLFTVRIAAGGWVFDSDNHLLMILRRRMWDIPKGHLEKGETLEECAIREVMEETGIQQLELRNYIGVSRHIFLEKGKWILKVSHWYEFHSDDKTTLKPQLAEGIETVEWVEYEQVEKNLKAGWPSLHDFYLNHKALSTKK